ncbi:MAG: addiction module protein [Pseudomonadota bacterium]
MTKLPLDQRIRLVQDLWESIAAESDAIPVDPEHVAEAKARLQEYRLDGEPGDSARAAVEQIRRGL